MHNMKNSTLLDHHYIFVDGNNSTKNTLLLLHGTGGDEKDLLDIGRMIDEHAHMLSVRGNVSEHGYNRFFKRFAEGVFDEEDIKKRSGDLALFIEAAFEKHKLQNTRLIAVGYSNGANIAAALMLLYPHLLSGGVLFRAMLPIQPPAKPDVSKTHVLLVHGEYDEMIPLESAEKLSVALEKSGADVSQIVLPTSHKLTSDDITTAQDWISNTFL